LGKRDEIAAATEEAVPATEATAASGS